MPKIYCVGHCFDSFSIDLRNQFFFCTENVSKQKIPYNRTSFAPTDTQGEIFKQTRFLHLERFLFQIDSFIFAGICFLGIDFASS